MLGCDCSYCCDCFNLSSQVFDLYHKGDWSSQRQCLGLRLDVMQSSFVYLKVRVLAVFLPSLLLSLVFLVCVLGPLLVSSPFPFTSTSLLLSVFP
ncbi:hypothetical protein RJT34_09899 [Clitoria ternatea]|uniref:Uncharacterized protein n=1 Tax=Clitoria ternatea TaxID=43366 RepID=A0AAN9K5H0_CLITE